ncbi:MAG: bifunctional diaminohydroxyphosphoribosylaminopyrimidine deaminase/5-amino-6-(5-phosphoribosylamino)uracil reductase RibD [Buchnera aphidicola (Nurudea yanoniella)]
MNDIFYMNKAIQLAKKGILTTSPNPNVGCIIVKNNVIIGKGWHKKSGYPHAEIYALKQAGEKAKGATVYVTLEPCSHFGKTPPCCIKLIQAGIYKIIISTIDPNPKVSGKGISWLKKKGIIVKIGIISHKSKNINKGFFKRMHTGMPWVQLKLASSIDGRTALSNGLSKWITSKKARQDVQQYRRQCDAIISSSKSVITDNALLTIRTKKIQKYSNSLNKNIKQPIRVIIDRKNRIQPSHKLIKEPGKIFLIRLKLDNNHWPNNVEQIIIHSSKTSKIDLPNLLKILGKREINKVLVESGASLSGSFLRLNLVNELIIYIAPKLLGHHSKPLFILKNYKKLSFVPKFIFKSIIKIGNDIKLILTKK